MPPKLLGVLAIIIVFSFIMSWQNRRRRGAVWSGVVVDIKHQRASITRDEDRAAEDWVVIFYRTDDGRSGKLKLNMASLRQFLPALQVGDRLVKREGDYLPRKADLVAETQTAAANNPEEA